MVKRSRTQRLTRSLKLALYPAVVYPPLLLNLKVNPFKFQQQWQFSVKKELTVPDNTFIYFLPLYGVLTIAIWLRLFEVGWMGLTIALLALAIASYYFRLPFRFKTVPHRQVTSQLAKCQSLEKRLQGKVLAASGTSEAPKGCSEAQFLTYLERYFKVAQNLKFDIPKTQLSYTPDFLIIDETGIVIDVEVDEPYEYKSKKPHHCVDKKEDHLRDAFFRDGNIIVIRFAEEQVVTEPLSCCKFIASAIDRCKGSCYTDKFEGVSDLKPIPRWGIKEAKAMAQNNYRDKYRKAQKATFQG